MVYEGANILTVWWKVMIGDIAAVITNNVSFFLSNHSHSFSAK